MRLEDINRLHTYLDRGDSEAEGNPKDFFGWALIGFIDLLGFSGDLASSWSDRDDSPLARLLRIKEAAARIPNAGMVAYFPGKPSSFDPKIHRARVHTVSDSIVVCYALPPAGNLNHIAMAMSVVSHGIQMAWATAIREGYTIRGAIELGQIYWSESETIGPAFVHSYSLEKIAKVSRVILGPLFLGNLLQRMNDDWSNWPSSEWLSVSHDKLIEISLHDLKDAFKGDLEGLEALRSKASANAYRYDHVLDILSADRFPKANRDDLERGRTAIESLINKALKRT